MTESGRRSDRFHRKPLIEVGDLVEAREDWWFVEAKTQSRISASRLENGEVAAFTIRSVARVFREVKPKRKRGTPWTEKEEVAG
jgi:hypothetical protein